MRNLRNRITNRFDRALLSGSFSAIVMLFTGTAILVFIGSSFVRLLGIHATYDDLNFVDSMWEILQRVIDPGQLANEAAWSSRLTLLTITIFGLLLVSTLISIINSSLERRIEGVRRGRRPVFLRGHIVIVGWNDAAPKLLEELAIARIEGVEVNVVLLTEEDPIDLLNYVIEHLHRQEEIDQRSETAKHISSWVTVRRARGDKTNDLLELGRIDEARAVICLLNEGNEHRNTRTVLATLAALQSPTAQRRPEGDPLQVIAQFNSEEDSQRLKYRIDKVVAARSSSCGALLNFQVITPDLVRNKIEVNVVRSKGLSAVYKDLLDLAGDEIYQVKSPHPGLRFGSLVSASNCIPLGLVDEEGVDLWPDWDTEVGDRSIVVLGQSMKSVERYINSWEGLNPVASTGERSGREASRVPEHYLFIGNNVWLTGLIRELNQVVPNLSTATLLVHESKIPRHLPFFAGNEINVVTRSISREPLDDSDFISRFDHVIVMADYDVDIEESDSRVLTDVLACRVHLETREQHSLPLTVVAELRKRASKHIAAVRMVDDLLVSESLTACAMAQFALYPENSSVLRHLLSSESQVFLQCIPINEVMSGRDQFVWSEIRDELRESTGEIALAVRTFDENQGLPQVTINPNDSSSVSIKDDVVVLTRLHSVVDKRQ
jgi:hypothetical protein